jgi:hypothetical protein
MAPSLSHKLVMLKTRARRHLKFPLPGLHQVGSGHSLSLISAGKGYLLLVHAVLNPFVP